ncbi:MAG: hypothetical protein ACP5OA_03815 [Candidatus Woesearchaeota archaeon]
MTKLRIEDLVRIIDIIDNNSKVVNEITGITKGVIAKDPDALNNNLVEYLVKSHFGEPLYDTIKDLYHNIMCVNGADINPEVIDKVQKCQDASADVNIKYVVKNQGD